jgi:hypothetical protein
VNQHSERSRLEITSAEGVKLIEQGNLIVEKMDELLNLVSLPEQEEQRQADDPVNLVIGLLTEIVRGQQSQRQWIEAISEKLDSMIENLADGTG